MMRIRSLAIVALTALTLSACESPSEPEDHAAGVVIVRADGSEAARYVLGSNPVSGQLSVSVGQTVTYRVQVLTENGAIVPIDGVEYSIAEPGVVIALAASIAVQGADQLTITGLSAGETGRTTTSIHFQLHHAGHPEFRAERIPLIVQ